MKKVKKFLLVILIFIIASLAIVPCKAQALSLGNVFSQSETAKAIGDNYLSEKGISISDIIGEISWIGLLAWTVYILAAVYAFPKWVIPAIKAVLTHKDKGSSLGALIMYVVLFAVGVVILWNFFPLILTTV